MDYFNFNRDRSGLSGAVFYLKKVTENNILAQQKK
jgi:hypothetical protein